MNPWREVLLRWTTTKLTSYPKKDVKTKSKNQVFCLVLCITICYIQT